MSSLEQQLSRLRIRESSSRNLGVNKVASLVFESSEAACMDWNTIYQLASQAFSTLSETVPLLAQHHALLFQEHLKLDRGQLTPPANAALSASLEEVLLTLQPYLLQKECQHILEYLLRNFEVHAYDPVALVLTMLPFHDTVLFVKLL